MPAVRSRLSSTQCTRKGIGSSLALVIAPSTALPSGRDIPRPTRRGRERSAYPDCARIRALAHASAEWRLWVEQHVDATHPPNSLVIHCLNGNLLRAMLGFGLGDDERVRRAVEWQARSIRRGFEGQYKSGTPGPALRAAQIMASRARGARSRRCVRWRASRKASARLKSKRRSRSAWNFCLEPIRKPQFRVNSVLAEVPMETQFDEIDESFRVPDEMWERTEPLLPPMFPSRKAVVLATTTGK